MLRLAAAVLVVASALVAFAQPASAGNTGWAKCGEADCDANARRDDKAAEPAGKPSSIRCTYFSLDLSVIWVFGPDGTLVGEVDGGGQWYDRYCTDEQDRVVWDYAVYLTPDQPGELKDDALAQLRLPMPALRMNPPGEQLVNVETWLYLAGAQWSPLTATAEVPGLSVTVTARPVRVIWDLGNGDVATCDGPGTPYDTSKRPEAQRTDCSYTYKSSSATAPSGAFTVKATVEWAASWTSSTPAGAAGGGALGTLRRVTSVQVPVGEAQAIPQHDHR